MFYFGYSAPYQSWWLAKIFCRLVRGNVRTESIPFHLTTIQSESVIIQKIKQSLIIEAATLLCDKDHAWIVHLPTGGNARAAPSHVSHIQFAVDVTCSQLSKALLAGISPLPISTSINHLRKYRKSWLSTMASFLSLFSALSWLCYTSPLWPSRASSA